MCTCGSQDNAPDYLYWVVLIGMGSLFRVHWRWQWVWPGRWNATEFHLSQPHVCVFCVFMFCVFLFCKFAHTSSVSRNELWTFYQVPALSISDAELESNGGCFEWLLIPIVDGDRTTNKLFTPIDPWQYHMITTVRIGIDKSEAWNSHVRRMSLHPVLNNIEASLYNLWITAESCILVMMIISDHPFSSLIL